MWHLIQLCSNRSRVALLRSWKIADDAENAAFNHRLLERAFGRPVLEPPYEIQDSRVFVALDPNGGASSASGPGSDTAIVSFVVSAGRLVIVGLDSCPTPGPEQARRLLYAHVAALQRQPQFASCRFMMILEANLGNEAQHCANYMLRRNPNNVDILCSRSHCYGVFTDPFDKERYVHSFQDRLAVDGLFFHSNIVCAARQNQQQTRAQVLEKTLNEFKRQLFAFRANHIVPNSLSARVRVIYSGKADKDGKRSRRLKDDMCMALLFGFFYCLRLNGPYKLVNTRDSRSMLEIDPITGAPLEGGPAFSIEHAITRAAKRVRIREPTEGENH